MVLGEHVGHIKPVNAVIRAGIGIRIPKASSREEPFEDATTLDGAENAGELAREVNLFRHDSIVQHPQPNASLKPENRKTSLQGMRVVTRRRSPAILAVG